MSLSLRAGRAALAEDMGMMSEEADLCDVLPAVWCEKTTTLQAQRTSFNTLDNWGHKTPTQSKRIKDRKERIKGSWPGTCIQITIHSVTLFLSNSCECAIVKGQV